VSKAELIRRELRVLANGAPAPRVIGIGSIKGMPRDLAANADYHLAESGFGER
jgi:hypothetical protein